MLDTDKSRQYSGLVWILSSITLMLYGLLGVFNQTLPGVEQLVEYASSVQGFYILFVAFIIIFIEGLYIIGAFFPGASLVGILAILSQTGGVVLFLTTILVIFIGWTLSGIVNITLASVYNTRILRNPIDLNYLLHKRLWITFVPTLRASYEVAQILEGGKPKEVFIASVREKFLVSIMMIGVVIIFSSIVDVTELNNEEGFIGLFILATISLIMGILKLKKTSIIKA